MPSAPSRLLPAMLVAMALLSATACRETATDAGAAVGRDRTGTPLCPLTGTPPPASVDPSRPAVAVKIENGPQARPQSGLEAADLVYEEPVEGGLTWLVALFQCSDPVLVGPVRDAHPADAAILAGHRPALFAHAGATPAVAGQLGAVGGLRVVDARLGGDAFQRVADRPIPHNLYVSMAKLRALASGPAPRPWAPFESPAEQPAPKGASPFPTARSAPSARFTQGPATIRWTWDKAAGAYVRQQGSAAATDSEGRPLGTANVVFLWVTVTEGETRDAAGTATPVLTLTGEGDALVLHDGAEHSGRWIRRSLADPPSLVDRNGRPMTLAPGRTWIHLVPADTPVFVR